MEEELAGELWRYIDQAGDILWTATDESSEGVNRARGSAWARAQVLM